MGKAKKKKRQPGSSKGSRRAIERRRAARRQLGWAIAAVAAIAVLVVFAFSSSGGKGPSQAGDVTVSGQPRTAPLAAGEAIPDFSAPALAGGGRVSWDEYRGRPAVLAVWASWCPHCQVELPVLSRVASDFPDVRLVSIVTAIGDRPGPSPEEYMQDEGLTFPVAVDDGELKLYEAFGIGGSGFPTTYWVGADGTVLDATIGETPEAEMRALFERVAATA